MNRARANASLIARSMTGGRGAYKRDYAHSSFADQADLTDKQGGGLTLSRSAGGIYYFDSNNVLQYTGDNVAAFEALGLRVEGQATNLLALANYRDLTTWTFETTDATTAKDQVGIDGVANSACILTDSTGAGYANKQMSIAVANDSTTYTLVCYLTKDNDTTRFPAIRMSFTGGTQVHQQSMINTSTAAITTYSASSGTHFCDVVGDRLRVTQILANNSTGNTTLRINAYPSAGTVFGTASTAATGSAIFDWFTVVDGAYNQSPIIGASTRYTSFFSRPWIGAVKNFWIYIDFTFLYSSAALSLASLYPFAVRKDASNYLIARFVSGGTGTLRVATGNAGVNQEVDIANFSIDRGDRCRMVVSYDEVNGLRCRASNNGAAAQTSVIATSKAAIPALASGANFYLGNLDAATTSTVNRAHYRDYRVGTGILTVAQQQELIGV